MNLQRHKNLRGSHLQCIAFDRKNPKRGYCGTFDEGLWKTDDYGQTWDSIGKNGISTSISVFKLLDR